MSETDGPEAQPSPAEPALSAEDRRRFREGVDLFNSGKFWHAHEAWEDVWRRRPGACDSFFKGLIQAAAAFHQMGRGRYRGTTLHFERSLAKLEPYAPSFLGVNVAALLDDLNRDYRRARSAGPAGMASLARETVPRIHLGTPPGA